MMLQPQLRHPDSQADQRTRDFRNAKDRLYRKIYDRKIPKNLIRIGGMARNDARSEMLNRGSSNAMKYRMNLQSFPQRREQVISQKASNDFLLFNMNDGNYYSLNEVGCRIWELCDGTHSIAQLAETLAAEYDAPPETLVQDVMDLLREFRDGKLLAEPV